MFDDEKKEKEKEMNINLDYASDLINDRSDRVERESLISDWVKIRLFYADISILYYYPLRFVWRLSFLAIIAHPSPATTPRGMRINNIYFNRYFIKCTTSTSYCRKVNNNNKVANLTIARSAAATHITV